MKKVVIALCILIPGLGMGGYYYFFKNKREPVRYRTARVEKGDITVTVSATGTLNPVVNVQVGSQVSGIIQALYVDYNSPVQKDQIIARLDPSTFQAQVTQASANLESARANLKTIEADLANLSANVDAAQARLKSEKANVEKAKVALKDAGQTLQRRQELFKQALIPASERDAAQTAYDSAVAQVKAAEAQEDAAAAQLKSARAQYSSALAKREAAEAGIKQAEAALEQAKVNLEHTVIRSPIEGLVISRSVDVGQTVAASLQAPTLFTIAQDLTKMQVHVSIDEADIGKVRAGQDAIFTVSAYPSERFTGKVVQVRNEPKTEQNVVTYDTLLSADNPELKLKPGMTATVSILIDRREGVKKVLNAALSFKPESVEGKRGLGRSRSKLSPSGDGSSGSAADRSDLPGRPHPYPSGSAARATGQAPLTPLPRKVWILNDGPEPQPVGVEVGITDGTYTEIKGDSLQEGQEVILGIEGPSRDSRPSSRPPTFGRPF